MNLIDITGVNLNNDNLGGSSHRLFAIEHSDVTGIVWPDAAGLQTMENNNTVLLSALNFTAAAMVEIEGTEYMTDISSEKVGTFGSSAEKHTFGYFLSKNNKKHLGFDRAVKNAKMIFFVVTNGGEIRVFGSDMFPATQESSASKNQKKPGDGEVGIAHTWESYGPGPSLILMGAAALATVAELELAAA